MESGKPTVVMVDDEVDFLRVVGTWAQPRYGFVGRTSGADLLPDLERLKPSLVVLDVGLPDVDGFEVCRRIRADGRFGGVPILFLTGRREDEDFVWNMRAGGTAYLTKPVGRRRLLALFRELISGPDDTVDTTAGD